MAFAEEYIDNHRLNQFFDLKLDERNRGLMYLNDWIIKMRELDIITNEDVATKFFYLICYGDSVTIVNWHEVYGHFIVKDAFCWGVAKKESDQFVGDYQRCINSFKTVIGFATIG